MATLEGTVRERPPMSRTSRDPTVSPSVSIVIPTLNAGRVLGGCLNSVEQSSLAPLETIVVDSKSSDQTARVAAQHGARLIVTDAGATRARLIGAEVASADFVLNLDADQRLEPYGLGLAMQTGADIIALGERPDGRSLVAIANRLHGDKLQREWRAHLSGFSSGILPRLYRRGLLVRALKRIPASIIDVRPSPYSEDALVYFEALRDVPTVAFVPNCLVHDEEISVTEYARKWIRNGVAARAYRGTVYQELVSGRVASRLRESLHPASIVSFALRAPWFALGYYL